jgi:endonuclease/exonuclease/phosphatase family metal-dependent hydrolase
VYLTDESAWAFSTKKQSIWMEIVVMFLRKFVTVLLLLSAGIACAQASDTLRVVNYNLLNFPGGTGSQRAPEFRKILQMMRPDVIAVQEMVSQAGVDTFLNDVLGVIEPDQWSAVPFHNGYDTDNALFYRTASVDFVSSYYISTSLRDIAEYVLRLPAPDTTIVLRIYSAHLKASQGEENEQRRLEEATVLRNYLNALPEGSEFLVVGDMNLYTSSEPAYDMLIGEPQNAGRSFDPIDTPGNWHNNVSFSSVHTQSPCNGSSCIGVGGGMDDRFDFLLASASIFDSVGFQYLEGSYTPFGNDGNHFNLSINDGENTAVPDSIADALYNASDHLPVFLDLLVHPASSSPASRPASLLRFHLDGNYPNPFNSQTLIRYEVASPVHVRLQVVDLLGRHVALLRDGRHQPGTYTVPFNAAGLPSGIYFYSLTGARTVQVHSMTLIR